MMTLGVIRRRTNEPSAPDRAEVVVVGSGPGGAITACLLAEAGRDVLLIEEGPYLPIGDGPTFSIDEMLGKYRNGGVTVALGRSRVAYVEGCCVGGGSEINSGLYHRTPPEVLDDWRRNFGVDGLSESDLRGHFEACEHELSVSSLPGRASAASLKLREGASRLGWLSSEAPRWHRYDAGHGPATPSAAGRQTMSRTYIPRALRSGCRLLPGTRVHKIRREGARWSLRCVSGLAGNGKFEIEAGTVFVCGGAIQTPALLRRSGITRHVGDSLRMHPTVKVVARFAEAVNTPGMGVPVHQVREFSPRYSFGGSISTPGHLALGLVAYPDRLGEVERDWPRLAAYYAMIVGSGSGTLRVFPGFKDPIVRYNVTPADRTELAEALRNLCLLLLRAGAVEVLPSVARIGAIQSEDELKLIPHTLPADANLMTVHLSSSCPFGEFAHRCAADSYGKVHGIDGLYVNDASLLCTQPVVNPQGTIMAVARRNVMRFLGTL